MTKITPIFTPDRPGAESGALQFRISRLRRSCTIAAGLRLPAHLWDPAAGRIQAPAAEAPAEVRQTAAALRGDLRMLLERLCRIDHSLAEESDDYLPEDIAEEYRRLSDQLSLSAFTRSLISRLRLLGRVRTAETYESLLCSFLQFRRGADLPLDLLTPARVEAYEAWLRSRGLVSNTVSFYCRILRAIYRRAQLSGAFPDRQPFRGVYTGVDKTVKRALSSPRLRVLHHLDLSARPRLAYARDIFILSFCLRGMSFIDMAYLRRSDLVDGYVTYRRRKTGQLLTIAWLPEMQQILDRWPQRSREYLIPILTDSDNPADLRRQARNACYNINRSLKLIAARMGITAPLTLYVARHSWASVAKKKAYPYPSSPRGWAIAAKPPQGSTSPPSTPANSTAPTASS